VQVVGVPDPKYGEELCAWVQLKGGATATAEELREFCRDQIAHYKSPRCIKFVDSFPMTVTGKVQKFVMPKIPTRQLLLAIRNEQGLLIPEIEFQPPRNIRSSAGISFAGHEYRQHERLWRIDP
jgi:AMP-binding enzyme C-terminal domain